MRERSRPTMIGSGARRKARQPLRVAVPRGLVCPQPGDWSHVRYGILFCSSRARMGKQELEPVQDPGLTHMSWRKSKWEPGAGWHAVLLGPPAGSGLGQDSA